MAHAEPLAASPSLMRWSIQATTARRSSLSETDNFKAASVVPSCLTAESRSLRAYQ